MVYASAAKRHIDAYISGEEFDPVDGTHHLGNVMACCAIILDAEAAGTLEDDRPVFVGLRKVYAWVEAQMVKLREKYGHMTPTHYTQKEHGKPMASSTASPVSDGPYCECTEAFEGATGECYRCCRPFKKTAVA